MNVASEKEVLSWFYAGCDNPPKRLSLEEWGKKYLSHYFPKAMSKLHLFLSEEFDALHHDRGQKIVVVGPRFSAKTTWMKAYAIRCIVEGTEPYILLIAETGPQAVKYLDAIKRELETNEKLIADYGDATGRGTTWNMGGIVTNNGIEVEALGMGHAIRGRSSGENRPTLVITDDPEGKKHSESPREREKSWGFFMKDVMNVGSEITNYLVAGTAIHRDCLVLRLLKTPDWRGKLFRSVEGMADKMDMGLWAEWESILLDPENFDRQADSDAFYEKNKKAMNAGATVLWPENESLHHLMKLRASIGHNAWELEKNANPINPELCEWPETYFGPHIWFDDWPETLELRVMSLDPSKGKNAKRGDYSAIIYYGVGRRDGPDGLLYVDADLKRRPTETMAHDFVEGIMNFRPDVAVIEGNAWQDLLGPMIEEIARSKGIWTLIKPIINRIKKEVRIRRLGEYLHRRLYRFKTGSNGTILLVEHLKDFPLANHDDGPDAMEMAQRAAIETYNSLNVEESDGLGDYLDVGVS